MARATCRVRAVIQFGNSLATRSPYHSWNTAAVIFDLGAMIRQGLKQSDSNLTRYGKHMKRSKPIRTTYYVKSSCEPWPQNTMKHMHVFEIGSVQCAFAFIGRIDVWIGFQMSEVENIHISTGKQGRKILIPPAAIGDTSGFLALANATRHT